MNLFVLALKVHVPKGVKLKKLCSLFETTADAFGTSVPDLDHLSFDECLEKYALFTQEQVEARLRSGADMGEVRNALYLHAYGLGSELREQLHLKSRADVLSVGRSLYRTIGIDFDGSGSGSVTIQSCFFSQFYTESVCHVMSSLDEGIAAGLSGGGKLSFLQRITEGKSCCKAVFDFRGTAE